MADARPRLAVVDDEARAAALRALDPRLLVTTPALPLAESAPPRLDALGPEAPALLAYTSGTTGRPKGALLSHGNLCASAEALRLAWRWTPADRLVHALPLFHVHGLGVALLGTLHAGASAVLLPRFEPDARARRGGGARGHALLRRAHHVAPAGRASARECAARAPARGLRLGAARAKSSTGASHGVGVSVLERYGMTETGMLVSNPLEGERRPGAVGFPLPGVELRLAASGEIEVRGPNVFAGYLERPDANAAAFTADRWFKTGDLGALDPDGYLRIVGRAKELVISGGYNVHPREVEEALLRTPRRAMTPRWWARRRRSGASS